MSAHAGGQIHQEHRRHGLIIYIISPKQEHLTHSAAALIRYDGNCARYAVACQGRLARELAPPPSMSISTLPIAAPSLLLRVLHR